MDGCARFLRAYLLLFVIHQLSSSMFRLIAGLCRTMVVANTGGTFALLIIFMLAGFIIPEPQIKAWWIWGYWSSPVAYAEKALTVNEFLAPQWAKVLTTSPLFSLFKIFFEKKLFFLWFSKHTHTHKMRCLFIFSYNSL